MADCHRCGRETERRTLAAIRGAVTVLNRTKNTKRAATPTSRIRNEFT
jgi:hypothetical protein